MRKYFIYLSLLLFPACSLFNEIHNKRFQRYADKKAEGLKHDPKVHWDSVVLDHTFQLYVRQVCRQRPPSGYYTSHNANLPASISRCNCEESKTPDPEKLEIQYLFYSAEKKQFVYITTIPPYIDRSQPEWRNTFDMPLFRVENFSNINYYNTFFFGRVSNGHLEMTPVSGDYPFQINYSMSPDGTVMNFEELLFHQNKMPRGTPHDDLGTPIRFYRKDHWMIGLDDKPGDATIIGAHNNFLENRTIYLISDANDRKHQPTSILFHFGSDFSGEPGQDWRWLHFEDFRIKSY